MGSKSSDQKPRAKHRKGLWSPEEDLKLRNYVLKRGHGCWTSVAINAGQSICIHTYHLMYLQGSNGPNCIQTKNDTESSANIPESYLCSSAADYFLKNGDTVAYKLTTHRFTKEWEKLQIEVD